MFRRILVFCLLAAIGSLAYAFYRVDELVGQRLNGHDYDKMPAVYSDAFEIGGSNLPSIEVFERELIQRGYRSADGQPSSPGEYGVHAGVIELVTREFRAPDGTRKESARVRYDAAQGRIVNHTFPQTETFYLEPTVVAALGNSERRASSYRSLAEIPDVIEHAVIAIEDERFYRHYGIDLVGVVRAALKNLRSGSIVEGGSGITQQLAKNLLFTPERTFVRKAKEAFAALSLERQLGKNQILELYLNEVYLGQEGSVALHGVAEAVQAFFAKPIEEITLAEAALLAGIIKAPSFYSARRHPDRALERRNVVLRKMLEANFVTVADYDAAVASHLTSSSEGRYRRNAPYFVAALEAQIVERFGVNPATVSGLSIFTGLDPNLQRCAEQAVASGVEAAEKRFPQLSKGSQRLEAALVAIEPFSGLVKAWVGGRDFGHSQFNHVNQARRQIGSTIKPFLYLTALDSSLNEYKTATVISVLSDRPMRVDLVTRDSWSPENYDRSFKGDVTLRYALENSLNLPAVSVGQKVGIASLAAAVEKFRITTEAPEVPALALGAADTTLLELTSAYAALANGGIYTAPRLFTSVQDGGGVVLATSAIREERVADEAAVYVLTNIMQGVVERGTGKSVRSAGYRGPAAGKTGTSNEARDAWFVGFSANMAVGTWLGFDDNAKIGLTGGTLAAPIWAEYMKCAEQFHVMRGFIAPPGVQFVEIDAESGQLGYPELSA